MRVLSAAVALTLAPPPTPSDTPDAPIDGAPGAATEADRSYVGITAVEREEGAYGELPPRWWAGEETEAAGAPPRARGDDLFVDPARPIEPADAGESPAPVRPDVNVDPLQLLAQEDPPDGRGLLITAGVFGGLAALSGLAVTQLASSHVTCLKDISKLQLVPCTEQVAAHRGSYLLGTSLFLAGVPFLAAGAVSHGRHLEREHLRPRLDDAKLGRRRAGGVAATSLGAALLATSVGVVAQVLLGNCTKACGARSIVSQVTWWTGTTVTALGVTILGYTHGRTHPAKPRRLRIGPNLGRGHGGLTLSGRF